MSILHLSSHTATITGICYIYIYGQHFGSMLVGNLWVTEIEVMEVMEGFCWR